MACRWQNNELACRCQPASEIYDCVNFDALLLTTDGCFSRKKFRKTMFKVERDAPRLYVNCLNFGLDQYQHSCV